MTAKGAKVVLFHATDASGTDGIRERGFGISHLRDSPESSWFTSARSEVSTGSAQLEWLVIVELPDDVARQYRHRFEDGTIYLSNYLVPWDVVNQYRPFAYERL